jgi:hypothetical protein
MLALSSISFLLEALLHGGEQVLVGFRFGSLFVRP